MNNNIEHPAHYCQGGIECIDAIKAATVGKTGIEAVCVANVIKYLFRYENKNGLEDCKKAQWYINRLIQEIETKSMNQDDKYDIDEDYHGCDTCKNYYISLSSYDEEVEQCTEEPCKSCKCNFVYGTKEYEEAPFNYEPKEN